jgi:hypothetical protein
MNELSSEARALLRASRSFDEPSAGDVARVRASVLTKVGLAVGVGAGMTAAASSLAASPAAVLGATVMKVGAAFVVAGGLATAGYVGLRTTSPKPAPAVVTTARAPAPIETRPIEAAPRVTGEVEPRAVEAPAPSPVKAPRSRPATAPRTARAAPDIEGEARLLEQADADLRRGDAGAALSRLAEHAAKYPDGALREEREGVRVVALCRAGREAEGKAAAQRFLSRAPRSALATRIRAACGE